MLVNNPRKTTPNFTIFIGGMVTRMVTIPSHEWFMALFYPYYICASFFQGFHPAEGSWPSLSDARGYGSLDPAMVGRCGEFHQP